MPTNSVFPTPIYAEMARNSEYEEIQSELTEALQSIDFHHPSLGDGHDLSLGEDGTLFSDNILEKYKCHKFLAFLYKNVMRYVADLGYFNYDNLASYEEFMSDDYQDNLDFPHQYSVQQSWFTKTNYGQYAPMHYHGSVDISGVYYLQTNGQDGNLTFYSPTKELISSFIYGLVDDKIIFPLEQGLLALWPGVLYHTTANNDTDHERISLSFNIQFPRKGFGRNKIRTSFNGVPPR